MASNKLWPATPTMEFESSKEMRELAREVCRAYPEYFGHIELDRILFLQEVTGERTRANGYCRPILPPFRDVLREMGREVDWAVEFYSFNTEDKSREWLAILMFHELLHITDGDSKARFHDIEDFHEVIDIAGVYWQQDRDLPDILSRKVTLRVA